MRRLSSAGDRILVYQFTCCNNLWLWMSSRWLAVDKIMVLFFPDLTVNNIWQGQVNASNICLIIEDRLNCQGY